MNRFWKNLLAFVLTAAVSALLLFVGDRWEAATPSSDSPVDAAFAVLLNADRYEPIGAVTAPVTNAWRAYQADGTFLGYAVTVTVPGYIDNVEVHTAVADDRATVKGIRIGNHRETEGYGARVAEAGFTDGFAARRAPFALGQATSTSLQDGVYRATESHYDASGFRHFVELTVSNGEIAAVNWDAEQQGSTQTKKELSRSGAYVMSDTGLPWHSQAEIMERALLNVQDPSRLVYSPDTGKTDAYTGATVTVSSFVELSAEAFGQAQDTNGTAVDGVSGATASSQAVVTAVNQAVSFVAALPAEETA